MSPVRVLSNNELKDVRAAKLGCQHNNTNTKDIYFLPSCTCPSTISFCPHETFVHHKYRNTTTHTHTHRSQLTVLTSGPQMACVFVFILHSMAVWVMAYLSHVKPVPGNQANSSIVKGDLLGNNSKPYVPVPHPSWLTPKHWQSVLFSPSLTHALSNVGTQEV